MKLLTNSSCADVASRGCFVLGSEYCNWGQTIFTSFSPRRSRSVSLCGLPLSGWAVVAPRLFHFTITALTIDRGSSSRAEIWLTDFLERCHVESHWAIQPFYCPCLSIEIASLCARFYTPVSKECDWNEWIMNNDEWETYRYIISYLKEMLTSTVIVMVRG
jgi:hypothetical protein